MFFKPIIERHGVTTLSEGLKLPLKNVRRWVDEDSIPSGYWRRIEAMGLTTYRELADAAEARLQDRAAAAAKAAAAKHEARA